MGSQRPTSDRAPDGRPPRIAIASEEERARAFASARRHSWLVRSLKIAIPVVVLAAIGAYAFALLGTMRVSVGPIQVQGVRIDPKNLTMKEPRYDGFGKDGTKFNIRAREAVADIKRSAPIRLNEIVADVTQKSGAVTHMTAVWGTYDSKASELELFEDIRIDGTNGLKARLSHAKVLVREGRVISDRPIEAEMPTGRITARSMAISTKTHEAAFREEVAVRLFPAAAKAKAAPAGAEGKAAVGARPASILPGISGRSDVPIDVTSESLDVDDTAKTAVFRTNVLAKQGEASLAAPELEVAYEGKARLGGEQGGQAAGGAGAGSAKLKSIVARGGVTLVSAAHRATAEEAHYDAATTVATLTGQVVLTSGADRKATSHTAQHDQAQDTAVLTGSVVVVQGQNRLTGERLVYDRKAGTSTLSSPAGDGRPAGRITAHLVQSDAQKAQAAKQAKAKDAEPAPAGQGMLGTAFKRDPNQPIDIDADLLAVDDKAKTATFRGNVNARQGDFVIRTVELVASYKGDAGLAAGGPSGGATPAGQKPAAQLTRIDARQRVVITTKDGQTATGGWASFDVKTNIAIIGGGDVVLSQNRSVVKGNRLRIDMTTGMANIEDDAIPAAAAGAAVKGAPARSARPSAVFYPDDLKKQQEERKKQGQPGGAQSGPAAPRPVPRVAPRKGPSIGPSASPGGWQVTTE